MKTRIITDAKIRVISGDRIEICRMALESPDMPIDFDDLDSPLYQDVEKELVVARRFYRMSDDKYESWLVGFDEEMCDMLEILPTGEIEHYEDLKIKVQSLENWNAYIRSLSAWSRIKYVFTGF